MLIVFLVLEYIRPPVIVDLKLQMVIIVLLLGYWLNARDRPWSPILAAQVVFFVICLAGITTATNTYAAYSVTRIMFGHVVLALAFSWLLSNRHAFYKVTTAWLLIMAYAAIYGIFHAGQGPGAQLGDENDLALGLATAFPFAFFGFEYHSGWRRWRLAAAAALFVGGIVATFSRGGFVALSVVALYCVGASRYRLRSLSLAVLALMALAAFAPSGYLDEIDSIQQTNSGTAKIRRFLWSGAVNMWKDYPLLGVGVGNFSFRVGRYQPYASAEFGDAEFTQRDWSGTVTHSIYFQTLSETGSVGILLLGFIVITHFRTLRHLLRDVDARPALPSDLRRDAHLHTRALGGAVVAYVVAGGFLSVMYYPYLWYFSAMAVALDVAIRREMASPRVSVRPLEGQAFPMTTPHHHAPATALR